MQNWHLYLIRCKNNVLYTGITTDVKRRFNEHCNDSVKGAKFLRGKGPLSLAFSAEVGGRVLASQLEVRVKKLKKSDKERLIAGGLTLDSLLKTKNKRVRLRDLPGLGVKSEAMLKTIGINTPAQLQQSGAVSTYLKLKQVDACSVSLNLLYAMVGALAGKSWLTIARQERERLLAELEGYAELEQMMKSSD